MEHKGTLPIGIEVDGKMCREYTLVEERFRHKLEVYTDADCGEQALKDPTYHTAAVLAKRLKIEGIEKVTPDMVLDLFPEDGSEIGNAASGIAARRSDFRSSAAGEGPP
jgi:hypothetical protein